MGRIDRITKALQAHDRELYADWTMGGACIGVFRKSKRFDEPVRLESGDVLRVCRPSPHFIFALTENWKTNGRPADWGLEPILARIKAMDLWTHESLVDELISDYKKDEESVERDGRNNIESFLIDYRRQFSKTFNDVNTSNLKKIDKRRLENGNRK